MSNVFLLGLAPMDGITDAPFRYIVDKYGRPDLLFTEFVSVDSIVQDRTRVLDGLTKHQTTTPTIAQLIGNEPEKFYQAGKIVLNMGFNGIDINMGCPDRSVNKRGAGASLINQPEQAIKIIKSVQKARDEQYLKLNTSMNRIIEVKPTVSVKTRLGISSFDIDWFKRLLEMNLDYISIHGRTFEQGFHGFADWEKIAKVVELAKGSKTKIFGNGDVKNKAEALEKVKQYKVNGILIGRASRGNPWVFADYKPTKEDRIKAMIEHCQKFLEIFPDGDFYSLRKHLAWYSKDFPNSARIRNQMMTVKKIEDVYRISSNNNFLTDLSS